MSTENVRFSEDDFERLAISVYDLVRQVVDERVGDLGPILSLNYAEHRFEITFGPSMGDFIHPRALGEHHKEHLAEAERLRRRNNQLDLELGAVRTKLEGERDALQQQLSALEVEWNHVQEAQIPDLHRALAESRAALAKYGRHMPPCRAGQLNWGGTPAYACMCALADALAATTPTAGGS